MSIHWVGDRGGGLEFTDEDFAVDWSKWSENFRSWIFLSSRDEISTILLVQVISLNFIEKLAGVKGYLELSYALLIFAYAYVYVVRIKIFAR